jgi:hypothetical protein
VEALEDRTVPSTFTVMNTSDSGAGSLRQAILDANAQAGADVINFDPAAFSTPSTIRLLSSLPDVTGDLTINGPTAARLTISGDANNSGANDDGDVRILSVSAGDVTLSDLTLTNGRARGADGVNGDIYGGDAGDAGGGAIYVGGGAVTLNNSTLSNNTAQGGQGGSGSLDAGACGSGTGGAIYVAGGAVTLNDSTLSNNTAQGGDGRSAFRTGGFGGFGEGGAIYVAGGAVTLNDSTLSNNTAQGGRGGDGEEGIFSGHAFGGAVSVKDGASATVINSTLSGNTAQGGAGGTAIGGGGGLSSRGTVTLTDVTVSGNSASSGGGLFQRANGTLTLTNTIVAGNFSNGSNVNIDGYYTSTHSLVDVDPMLAPLGDYGGPTQTMAPLPGSPAIDAGDSTAPGLPATDQRGFARVSGAAVDIGACEVQAISLSPAALPNGAYGAAYSQTITATGGAGVLYTFAVTAGALPAGLTLAAGGALTGTPTALGSSTFTVTATDGLGFTAGQSYTLTVNPPPLSASGINISATAGTPFSGAVATISNPDPYGGAASYTAVIAWGDGNTSAGVVSSGTGGTLTVSGSHTYADPVNRTISVTISHVQGYTTTATTTATATVTSSGQGVQQGLTGGIGFWHNNNGQALINSFNGGPAATALANWLALSFPNLYGASAGANDLTGRTNAQVAAFYQSQFNLGGSKAQAQTLAVALNVYATTSSLGGSAGASYGFTVSATGLGARSYNVGPDGAAFGVANNTTLNVYELLVAVNKKAVKGVLYNGDATLQAECADLFNALNTAGGIG